VPRLFAFNLLESSSISSNRISASRSFAARSGRCLPPSRFYNSGLSPHAAMLQLGARLERSESVLEFSFVLADELSDDLEHPFELCARHQLLFSRLDDGLFDDRRELVCRTLKAGV
jgi:hypothetical protein